jgi:hypothetical protein
MAVIHSCKMILDEALAVIGMTNNTDARARALRLANELIQRVCVMYDFSGLFVFWKGEIPKADNVDRTTPLELANIPRDLDKIQRAWFIEKRTDGQIDRQPLVTMPAGEFMDQFMTGTFDTTHDQPVALAVKRVEAIRQDVGMAYRLNPNALELATLSGQDGWTMGAPAGTLAAIQHDTPLAGDRAVKFAIDSAPPPVLNPLDAVDFESYTVGNLDGQDGWINSGGTPAGTMKVTNTAGEVLAGTKSASGDYCNFVPGGLYRRAVVACAGNVYARWEMRLDSTVAPALWQFMAYGGAVRFAVNLRANGTAFPTVEVQDPAGNIVYTGTLTQAAPYSFEVKVIAGTLTLAYNSAVISSLAWGAADFNTIYVKAVTDVKPAGGYCGSIDNITVGTISAAGSVKQYAKVLTTAKRYQFSCRVRRNPDLAAGVDSEVSLMVATASTVARVDRVANAILGIDVTHLTDTSATVTVYHDGAVKLLAHPLTLEEDAEFIVIVDEERSVLVYADDEIVYSGVAATVAADRLLMSGDAGVVTRVAWQGLALDMTGLTVESTALEAAATEAAVTIYTDPEQRTEQRYAAVALSTTPSVLVAGTFHGVKGFTKSDLSRGLITLKSGGQVLAVLRQGEMAAEAPVLVIGGFPDRPYALVLYYKRKPPMLMGPGDAVSFLPECAVRWVIQKLKVTLMKGKEDIDWQAEGAEDVELRREMMLAMRADRVDVPHLEFEGY